MASGGLLLLLDDVASLTHAAAKKTAGIVGDDLALNSKALIGIDPARELPIVWQVAKGSLKNKAILIPGALLLTAVTPWAILPLMMLGGAYLCFEGAEKLLHSYAHRHDEHPEAEALAVLSSHELEQEKVKSAIRTDLILSAEIIVVSLGAIGAVPFLTKAMVLTAIGLGITVGVYGLVGGLVKLDDIGLHLMERKGGDFTTRSLRRLGMGLVLGAPKLLTAISVLGTAAMFTVGGGILLHGFHTLEHWLEEIVHGALGDGATTAIALIAISGIFGVVAGFAAIPLVKLMEKPWSLLRAAISKN